MPTVTVDKDRLFNALERPTMTIEEFEEICFEFGVELDDVTSERELMQRETGGKVDKSLSDKVLLKIDVSANRYDLLCEEGLSRAIRVYLGLEKPAQYTIKPAVVATRMTVKANTRQIRPYVVCAVLRNVTLSQHAYESFIELQEKLHQGLCRRRTKVAIGTHDLDKLKGPFVYDAKAPENISFIPLNQKKQMNGLELMEFYESDRRLSKFLPIIRDSTVFPVITDASGTVLSLPPIINGDHSKISVDTKNIFIECTATEESKASTVLNMVVAMFSQYCKEMFSVEQVEIFYEQTGMTKLFPDLSERVVEASAKYINSFISADSCIPVEQMQSFLSKMGLVATRTEDEVLKVRVPVTRSDILHQCDIMEDVAVAYGINNIKKTLPKTTTVAAAFPLNKLSDLIRREVALCGWTEVLPLTLCSKEENFDFLQMKDPGNLAVELLNPATAEYQIVRTMLIPGILKTAASNKKSALPWKLFEVGDICLQDPQCSRRARNERHLCALYSNKQSGFELIHGLLDRVMQMLNVPLNTVYKIQPSDLPMYFPGRQAHVLLNDKVIGSFGILHPKVLENYEIGYPCSVLEINLEPFL